MPFPNFVPWDVLVSVCGGDPNKTVILHFFICKVGTKYIRITEIEGLRLGRLNEIMPIVA